MKNALVTRIRAIDIFYYLLFICLLNQNSTEDYYNRARSKNIILLIKARRYERFYYINVS